MKRAVGYCVNVGQKGKPGCDEFTKGGFLLNHGETFCCPHCRMEGKLVPEQGYSNAVNDAPFKECRVEYNYDPIGGRFQEIAIVRDESLWGSGSSYTLLSPLIKTEKRALKVAESILANLQRYRGTTGVDEIPRTTEIILSFDDDFDEFQRKVQKLGEEWEHSKLVQQAHTAGGLLDRLGNDGKNRND